MIAWVHFPDLPDSQAAFATVAVEMLPVGASGIVLAGSVSALMSTASGTLLASSTVLASDVYRRFLAPRIEDARFLLVSRTLTGGLGLGVVLTALLVGDVILALDIAYTFLSGAIFVPVMAALFWRRATSLGTLVSMCASTGAASLAMLVWGAGSSPPIAIGLATSLVVLVAASFVSDAPAPERLAAWERRLETGDPR
jgi:SSS family solute:Na+ symporter